MPGEPRLGEFEAALLLPPGFSERDPLTDSEKVQQVLALRSTHRRRRYLTGVLLAYVAMTERLLGAIGLDHVDDVLTGFVPLTEHGGRRLNTLTLRDPGDPTGVLSLRSFYNAVEKVIRLDLGRPDYPNAAPHATQSWSQHSEEFTLIVAMHPGERLALAESMWAEILAIPAAATGAGQERSPRPFEALLRSFPGGVSGEPPGAVLQGLAFAYYRADSPNVTLRVHKSGTGGRRVGAIGDVDGWVGSALGLSVEVKDHDMTADNLHLLASFVGGVANWPDATSIVLARSFTDEAQDQIAEWGILALDRERMASNVVFWDLPKQRLALREFEHYVSVIQGSARLIRRFEEWRDNLFDHDSEGE